MGVLKEGYLFRKVWVIKILKIIDFFLRLKKKFIKPQKLPNNIQSILLIRPDQLGDILITSSVFPLIRKKYPNANIDLIHSPWTEELLKDNPYISNRYTIRHYFHNRTNIPKWKKWIIFFKDYISLFFKLRKKHYDVCIIMRSYAWNLITLAKMINCKCIISHKTGGLGELADIVIEWVDGKHEVEHFLELLEPLGVKADVKDLRYFLTFSPLHEKRSIEILNKYQLSPKNFVIIHPGSGEPKRRLKPSTWARIIQKRIEDEIVVFTGTKSEQKLMDDILREYYKIPNYKNKRFYNLMGEFSIRELALFFKYAKKIYTVESLAMHLTQFSDTPVEVFWISHNADYQWKVLNKSNLTITKINEDTYLIE